MFGNRKPISRKRRSPALAILAGRILRERNIQIDGPENVRIGQYSKEIGGWPVYADYSVSYQENGISFTQHGSKETPAAYAKVEDGTTVCFTPDLLKMLGNEMDAEFEKAFAF